MKKDNKKSINYRINEKKEFTIAQIIIFVLIIISITIVVTIFFNTIINNKNTSKTTNIVPSDISLEDFKEVYDIINDDYYKKVDKNKLIEGAINGMLKTLDDPHTMYMSQSETESFNEIMNGSYEGIGAEIALDSNNNVIIYSVFKNSPAYEAGLKYNDIILKVNGKTTEKLSTTEVVKLIKDENYKTISILVKRNDKQKEFKITKRIVEIQSVESKVYERNSHNIGYISINNFANNTYNQFKSNIEELEAKNISGLIIDVRSNTGGYLDCVSSMLDILVSKDKIIYQIQDKKTITKYKSKSEQSRNYPIVVLTDESSASASEILAISLKESYGADTVGKTTYGKGTVQVTKYLTNGAMVKYTIQKWLSPNGNWINKKGVVPTYETDLSENYLKTRNEEDDSQLQKALEVILNKILNN